MNLEQLLGEDHGMSRMQALVRIYTLMSTAIHMFSRNRQIQGIDPHWPKYLYLGTVEQEAWKEMGLAAPHVEVSDPDRSPKRVFMGVEVIFVQDKDTFLTVGL